MSDAELQIGQSQPSTCVCAILHFALDKKSLKATGSFILSNMNLMIKSCEQKN